jgi:hypothetical protein
MSSTFPIRTADLPAGEFYAILTPESQTIAGDERSRTNPGHGYPEHTVYSWKIEVFPNREKWEAEVAHRTGLVFGRQDFKAVVIKPATVTTTLKITVTT